MQQPIVTNDVVRFTSTKESQYFDRKSARKDDKEIAKHISAFANAAGGKLVIGIEDDGEVTGFRRNGARDVENFERAPIATCSPSPVVRKERIPVVNSSGEDDVVSFSMSRLRRTMSCRGRATARCFFVRTTRALS